VFSFKYDAKQFNNCVQSISFIVSLLDMPCRQIAYYCSIGTQMIQLAMQKERSPNILCC